MKRWTMTGLLIAAFTSSPLRALALPTFPAEVDTFLNMPGQVEKIFPSTGSGAGCGLCHIGGIGGGQLTGFGTSLMLGSTPSDPALLSALGSIESSDPKAIEDLEMGIDPNTDPSVENADPTPQYGCSMGGPARPDSAVFVLLAGLLLRITTRARGKLRCSRMRPTRMTA